MSPNAIAFVGDVHGNSRALRGLMAVIEKTGVEKTVFLGDYLNKGPDSAGVIELLLNESKRLPMVLLKGNHEKVFLEALDSADLAHFLKIGGAKTIHSYLRRPVGPNVIAELVSEVPEKHIDFIRRMPDTFEDADVIASHVHISGPDVRYRVSAHVSVGPEPLIESNGARIDTGCGSFANGRLTAFIWPARTYFQVESDGTAVV